MENNTIKHVNDARDSLNYHVERGGRQDNLYYAIENLHRAMECAFFPQHAIPSHTVESAKQRRDSIIYEIRDHTIDQDFAAIAAKGIELHGLNQFLDAKGAQ